MNQNDMDRYRWRTGQRWSGDRFPASRGRRNRSRLLILVIGFCLFVALLLGLHGCGPVVNAQFDRQQRAIEDRKLKEIHGSAGKNPGVQFAEAMKAGDQQAKANKTRAGEAKQ